MHQELHLESPCEGCLVAPYRAILRYYRCDTPCRAIHVREVCTPPKLCDTPSWHLVSHRHICAMPHFATYRAIIVRYPMKTSTKEFCDTIAGSIALYGKYRCWASKVGCSGGQPLHAHNSRGNSHQIPVARPGPGHKTNSQQIILSAGRVQFQRGTHLLGRWV